MASEVLCHIEIGLGVFTREGACHRDRRDVVQGRVEPAGQPDDGAGALDVGGALFGLAGGDVVDRRGMHHMVDTDEFGDGLIAESQTRAPSGRRRAGLTRSPHSAARRSKRASESRRTSTQTRASGSECSSRVTTWRPMKPVPPVTT